MAFEIQATIAAYYENEGPQHNYSILKLIASMAGFEH